MLVQSETLNGLSDRFEKAAEVIRSAIANKQPIVVRHHTDIDGYSGAVALERALLPLIQDAHDRERDHWNYYTRIPSPTPFYDYGDALKDTSIALLSSRKFGNKMPLVIVIDNGSGKEDVLALKQLKMYGVNLIVIDHHPAADEIDEICDVHINTHVVTEEYGVCSGMLCSELAHILYPQAEGLKEIATISGIGDKCTEAEEYKQYAQGFDEKFLRKVGVVVDFMGYTLGYMESRFIIDDLFGRDKDKQKELVKLHYPEIESKKEVKRKVIEHYIQIEDCDSFAVAKLDISKIHSRGEYPRFGILVGMTQEVVLERMQKPVVAIGRAEGFVSFRASKETDFSLHRLMDHLKENFPYAHIGGGGHDRAGSLHFVALAQEEVLAEVDSFLRS